MFDPYKFLCPQAYRLSRFVSKDFPRIRVMPQGLPEWLNRNGFYIHQSRIAAYEGFKQEGCTDLRACYMRHLDVASEVRIAKVAELAAKPFDQSEVDQWNEVAYRITAEVVCEELKWFTEQIPEWSADNA